MRKVLLLLGSFVLLAAGLDSVLADCKLSVPEDPSIRPTLLYPFGWRLLQYPEDVNVLFLRNGQMVYSSCATGFEDTLQLRYNIKDGAVLVCENNQLYLESPSRRKSFYERLQCEGPKWSLYETKTNRECPSPESSSFVMAISNLQVYNVLGHLCYDTESMTPKRLQYVLQEDSRKNKRKLELPSIDITLTSEEMEIKDFLTGFNMMYAFTCIFANCNTSSNKYAADRSQENWLKLSNYQSRSIVQLGYQSAYFNNYAPLTNISWWPSLLYGNWQRYTEALMKHLPSVSGGYSVYVGVEGSVKSPTKTKCSQTQRQDLLISEQERPIPLYVWNYLKANDNSEGIVIIGYNSPFFEYQPSGEAIFCQDICHDIAWLKNATDTFRYTAMGVIFCCRPDDVLKSGKLPDFPQEQKIPLLLEADSEENTIQGSSDSEITTGAVDPGTVEPPLQDGEPGEEVKKDEDIWPYILGGAAVLALAG